MGTTLRRDFCETTRWLLIRLFFCWSCSPGHPNRASASLIMEGHIQQIILQQRIMEQRIIMEGHTTRRQLLMEDHTKRRQLPCQTVVLLLRGVSRVHDIRV